MKQIIVLLLINYVIYPLAAQDFPIDSETGKIAYVDVVDVKGKKTDALYNSAREWVALAFKSAQDVIQYEDKKIGKIICKGVIKVDVTGSGMKGTIHETHAGNVSFVLTLEFKDDRFRYSFTDFTHDAVHAGGKLENEKPACGGMSMTKQTWASIKQQLASKMDAVLEDMAQYISKVEEEW